MTNEKLYVVVTAVFATLFGTLTFFAGLVLLPGISVLSMIIGVLAGLGVEKLLFDFHRINKEAAEEYAYYAYCSIVSGLLLVAAAFVICLIGGLILLATALPGYGAAWLADKMGFSDGFITIVFLAGWVITLGSTILYVDKVVLPNMDKRDTMDDWHKSRINKQYSDAIDNLHKEGILTLKEVESFKEDLNL